MDPFAQAQEDLARERLMAQFRRVLPYAAVALAVLLAGVAIRETYEFVSHRIHQSRSEDLSAALNAEDSVAALTGIAEKDGGARAALAGLIAFQRMDLETQKTEGVTLLQNMAQDKSLPKEWRDYAALTLVKARVAFGSSDADDLLATLKPVTHDDKSPWQSSALIQEALIYGEMKKDSAAAAQSLQKLREGTMTPELAEKANVLRGLYGTGDKQ